MQDAEARLKDITEEIKTVKSAIEAKPIADKTALESELSSYPEALKQFPKDGMHQLEKYESHLHPKAARLEGLRAKAAELRRQAELLAQMRTCCKQSGSCRTFRRAAYVRIAR